MNFTLESGLWLKEGFFVVLIFICCVVLGFKRILPTTYSNNT